jgi:hypothetical protein
MRDTNPFRGLIFAVSMLSAASAFAQSRERASFVPDLIKSVLFDPTTYVPAIVAWESTRLDWQTSQVFFQHGFLEQNARFTVSGRANATAVGYGAGNRLILTDALVNVGGSVANNVTDRLIERGLLRRYPTHRTLIRAIGWVERGAVASYVSYLQSASHWRQWQENQLSARQLGYN